MSIYSILISYYLALNHTEFPLVSQLIIVTLVTGHECILTNTGVYANGRMTSMPLKAVLPLSQIRKRSSRLKILQVKIGKGFLHNAHRDTLRSVAALLCSVMDGNVRRRGTLKHLLKVCIIVQSTFYHNRG